MDTDLYYCPECNNELICDEDFCYCWFCGFALNEDVLVMSRTFRSISFMRKKGINVPIPWYDFNGDGMYPKPMLKGVMKRHHTKKWMRYIKKQKEME